MRKKQAIVVLALLLPILIASSEYALQPAVSKSFTPYNPNFASDPINYSIGVLPGEEYAWIITALRQENLEKQLYVPDERLKHKVISEIVK